jgi:hypothetical protein
MSWKSVLVILLAALTSPCLLGMASDCSDPILLKAARLFGNPLNNEHKVFPLGEAYVVWPIQDTDGTLLEVDVGPKSFYTTEFPHASKPSKVEFLSDAEYNQAIGRISQLKDVGKLQQRHGHAGASSFGPLNTDRFEQAFVDRVVLSGDDDSVKRFNVYFLQDMAGSPEQVVTTQAEPMVCLVGLWYYTRPNALREVRLGKWQNLRVAGPNLHGNEGCFRTTVLHDADGFTIEEPQNETIIIPDPYTVRALAGHVILAGSPVEAVNVEFRRMGSKRVLRSKTDLLGAFKAPRVREGRYKFKVTKDGFKAISGTIIVDHRANTKDLSFELHLGT